MESLQNEKKIDEEILNEGSNLQKTKYIAKDEQDRIKTGRGLNSLYLAIYTLINGSNATKDAYITDSVREKVKKLSAQKEETNKLLIKNQV
jgi:hypothetical protein